MGRSVRLIACDAEALPFNSSSMDVVMCGHALEHIENPGTALAEMTRVLRPGGVLLVIITRAGIVDSVLRLIWRYRLIQSRDLLGWMWSNDLEPLHVGHFGKALHISRWLAVAVLARKAVSL
jgi:ubiquinone/menaquinone biosynthesis C-methylase UbiE